MSDSDKIEIMMILCDSYSVKDGDHIFEILKAPEPLTEPVKIGNKSGIPDVGAVSIGHCPKCGNNKRSDQPCECEPNPLICSKSPEDYERLKKKLEPKKPSYLRENKIVDLEAENARQLEEIGRLKHSNARLRQRIIKLEEASDE